MGWIVFTCQLTEHLCTRGMKPGFWRPLVTAGYDCRLQPPEMSRGARPPSACASRPRGAARKKGGRSRANLLQDYGLSKVLILDRRLACHRALYNRRRGASAPLAFTSHALSFQIRISEPTDRRALPGSGSCKTLQLIPLIISINFFSTLVEIYLPFFSMLRFCQKLLLLRFLPVGFRL
jgi:hypothetical protein